MIFRPSYGEVSVPVGKLTRMALKGEKAEASVLAALKQWREGLIGLTGANRLIKFRASKRGSVLIDTPDADATLTRLLSGRPIQIVGDEYEDTDESVPPEERKLRKRPTPASAFHAPVESKDLGATLRNLMRRADTEFLDRGLSILYTAFGQLKWKDADGSDLTSPLLLIPIRLIPEGPNTIPRVQRAEDDAVFNPALTLRLQEFKIQLPTLEEVEELTVTEMLALVDKQLKGKTDFKDWSLGQSVYISTFSFAKEAMYRDLLDNHDLVAMHPLVQALAISDPSQQSEELLFDPIDPSDIESLAAPEVTPLVLEADSSQRAAVAAALGSNSFVMDGPPGTGKSQTIANMIGVLLHAGKTVLFVSEKMAALEVVRNRLNDVGLGHYLLELHSHKANRREVASELLRTLDNAPVPPVGLSDRARSTAKNRRLKLNAYAEAMNEVRSPLEMSLHHVLGLISGLSHVPAAPVPDNPPKDLSQESFFEVQEISKNLERVWRPAREGRSFLWREVTDQTSLESRLFSADSALEQLDGTLALLRDFTEAFGFTKSSDVPRVVDFLAHQRDSIRWNKTDSWLSTEDFDSLSSSIRELRTAVETVETQETKVRSLTGHEWTDFNDSQDLPEPLGSPRLTSDPIEIKGLRAEQLLSGADTFERWAVRLTQTRDELSSISETIGLGTLLSIKALEDAARLMLLRDSSNLPERAWFDPTVASRARIAHTELKKRETALKAAEEAAESRFTSGALQAPLAELQERFLTLHKGLKKLSGAYRADKKAITALLINAKGVRDGIQHLSDAIEWKKEADDYSNAVATHSEVLGDYWHGRDTKFKAVGEAIELVETALALCESKVPPALARFLSSSSTSEELLRTAEASQAVLEEWRESLQPAPAISGRTELQKMPFPDAIMWLTGQVGPLRNAGQRTRYVDEKLGKTHTSADAEEFLSIVQSVRNAVSQLQENADAYTALFGENAQGRNTDFDALNAALAWAEQLRSLNGGAALSSNQIKTFWESPQVDNLMPGYEKWLSAKDKIIDAFGESRHEDLNAEFDDFKSAKELLTDLKNDTLGQEEWLQYAEARAVLEQRGLGPAIDFCVEHRVSNTEVPDILERALLRSWADWVLLNDQRLQPFSAADRTALIEEYRQLDQDLVLSATSEIIRSVNSRRPANTSIGEPSIIRREGAKQRKHKPVRDLVKETRQTTQSIKPCFMMSPLAVSQYLPADMVFDTVIFDEASQVSPGDAINCIYRGRNLILAGDDKQLPPTSFFEKAVEDEGDDETDVADFTSILELAKASGAMNSLGLKWHYRSRHEDLIAFSNYKFYEGNLVTYPSARAEGEDVGVVYFNANGTYRRGGGADNPKEAEFVANRVIEHFTNRPQLTLGVVTFSVAQADAVVAAVDRAREQRRDLDRFFESNDRLDGFFVRSLETVQGDERDVIIFSVGYGPDEAGKVTSNFGVLNKDKGWRRLNVGITRARQRVELVASMHAGDIPPSTNESVEHLRNYLDYAERGTSTLAITSASTGLGPDSPFEESVIRVIQSWGYTIEPQVGAAGFRIDIGVRHPAHPGAYALGVECDGFQYHSAPAARDRDRLRESVLRGLGWELHRIWGTAWYRNRVEEEARLKAAIEAATAASPNARVLTPPLTHSRVEVATQQVQEHSAFTWTTPYRIAQPVKMPSWVDPSESGNHLHMVPAIEALVSTEGPIHEDVLRERLREWWGVGRIGSKIRQNLDLALRHSQAKREGEFFVMPGYSVSQVRTPIPAGQGRPAFSRSIEQIHPEELTLAILMLLREAGSVDRDELPQVVSRVFGWGRTGANVEAAVTKVTSKLLKQATITERDGRLAQTSQ